MFAVLVKAESLKDYLLRNGTLKVSDVDGVKKFFQCHVSLRHSLCHSFLQWHEMHDHLKSR